MEALEKTSYILGYSDGQDESIERVYDWLMDEKREPAQTKFLAGKIRNLAKEIEFKPSEVAHAILVNSCPLQMRKHLSKKH